MIHILNCLLTPLFALAPDAPEAPAQAQSAIDEVILNHKFHGNEPWRFGLLLLVILATLFVGRMVRFFIERTRSKTRKTQRRRPSSQSLPPLPGPPGRRRDLCRWSLPGAPDPQIRPHRRPTRIHHTNL